MARRALLERYPTLAEDDPALVDTLDGLSDLREAILAVIESADDDQMLLDGIRNRMERLHQRAQRLMDRIDRKHEIARSAMELGGRRKLEAPEVTLSLAKSPRALVITDERQIPATLKIMPEPVPDKAEIKRLLLGGTDVPGALLNNPADHLVIRRS